MYIYKDYVFPHLTEQVPAHSTISADKNNEAFCTACGARISIGERSGDEYGHGRGCPNREFDNAVSATNRMAEFVCDECGAGFSSEDELTNHEEDQHDQARSRTTRETADLRPTKHTETPAEKGSKLGSKGTDQHDIFRREV